MLRNQTPRWTALLAVLALAACGGGDARAGESANAESSAAEGVQGAAPGGSATTEDSPASDANAPGRVEATVSKAPFAGTHQMSGDMTCSMFNGMWQATLEQDRAAGLSGMLVMLKDVPAAGGSTDKVTLNLAFGHMGDDDAIAGVIDVHGSETGGDARGTVTREGRGAVLRVEGTTHAGARVETVVRCGAVDFLE